MQGPEPIFIHRCSNDASHLVMHRSPALSISERHEYDGKVEAATLPSRKCFPGWNYVFMHDAIPRGLCPNYLLHRVLKFFRGLEIRASLIERVRSPLKNIWPRLLTSTAVWEYGFFIRRYPDPGGLGEMAKPYKTLCLQWRSLSNKPSLCKSSVFFHYSQWIIMHYTSTHKHLFNNLLIECQLRKEGGSEHATAVECYTYQQRS